MESVECVFKWNSKMLLKDKIIKIYEKRQEAHNMLLECDKEIDKLLKEKLVLQEKFTCCMDGCADANCKHCK